MFLAVGIYQPFWPVFLKSRGLSAAEIGLIFALASWIRIATGPAIAQIADRSGRAKATLVVVAALCLAIYTGFYAAQGFWPILLIMLPASICFQPMIPLIESQTMAAVRRERLDYGRIRLWGSLTFILGMKEERYRESINKEWLKMFPSEHDRPARHAIKSEVRGEVLFQIEIIGVI